VGVLSSHAQAIGDGDAVSPGKATLAGPVLAIPAENPSVSSCAIDLVVSDWQDASDEQIDRLLGDLASGLDRMVGYRNGQRLVRVPEAVRREATGAAREARLRQRGVYLITGAFGGVGGRIAIALAERVRARLVLVARTPLPSPETWAAHLAERGEDDAISRAIRQLARIEALGGESMVVTGSVADDALLRGAVEAAGERWGGVNGIIHAAGIAGGGVVQLKTKEAADRVFAAKIHGTEALARAIGGAPLDFFVLCSSLASVLGGAGQSDYTAANAYLDAFANDYRRRTGAFAISIDWDAWRDAGMAVDTALPRGLEDRREAALARGMSGDEGIDVLLRVLALDLPAQVLVSTTGFGIDRRQAAPAAAGRDEQARPAASLAHHSRPTLATAFAPPVNPVEQTLAGVWQRLLGIEAIGRHDNFFDLGGHSLLLVQAHATITQEVGRAFPVTALFEFPTIASLAAHLGGESRDEGAPMARAVRPSIDAIAIVGLTGRFAGARDLDEFWNNLRQGVEGIVEVPDDEVRAQGIDDALLAQPGYVRVASVPADVDRFDASFFGYTPREAELIDPQHRLFLECAWEALERAGYDPARHQGSIGVFAGASSNGYLANIGSNPDVIRSVGAFQAAMGSKSDFLPSRVSYKLNLRGPSVNVQTACSTSLVAVHQACRSLLDGECDIALAGGVSIGVPLKSGYLYQEEGILSPDGHCRPFDALARGTVPGSGAGVVVLKRLQDALAGGDTIAATIRGTAVNNDGASKVGYTAPSVSGQASVIAKAQAVAGVEPSDISYVEAHGTATALGDPIEIAALDKAFGPGPAGSCAIGAVKSNIGHLDVASGIAGLIKTVLALQHRELPPSLHYRSANPQIDFPATRFFVNATSRPWPASDRPRIAGVSSFGIGGTNAHAIVEEAPAAPASGPSRPWQLLVLSAKSPVALTALTDRLATFAGSSSHALPDVAYTLQVGRGMFAERRAIVCRDMADAAEKLRAAADRAPVAAAGAGDRSCVFMFSGQGAQYAGMAADLYRTESGFRDDIDRCCEAVAGLGGLGPGDLRAMLFPPEDRQEEAARELAKTAVAQPALFIVEYALARLWMQWGVRPSALVGHSLGEYVAGCLAGIFTLEDALRLVVARGRAMQAMAEGAMLAVPLAAQDLEGELPPEISLAAINAPLLSVLSGPTAAVAACERALLARGVACRRLQTSHAFHSAMMDPALEEFRAAVAATPRQPPAQRIVSNVTGDWLSADEAVSVDYWVQHLRQPVRFADGIRTLSALSGPVFLEIGPGRTLATYARQTLPAASPDAILTSLRHPQDETSDVAHLLGALGRLWTGGFDVDWQAFWAGEQRRRVPLPTYPFQRQRYWIEKGRVDEVARVSRSVTKTHDLDSWFYVPAWVRAPRPAVPASEAYRGTWLLFDDRRGISGALAEMLRLGDARVIRVRPGQSCGVAADGVFTVDPDAPAEYDQLVKHVAEAGEGLLRIVHLWSVGDVAAPGKALDLFSQAQAAGFYSVLYLTQALLRHGLADAELTLVGDDLFRIDAADVLTPEKSPAVALCTVIAQEHPGIRTAVVDIGRWPSRRVDQAAERLFAELCAVRNGLPIAYRGPQRWMQQYEAATTAPAGWDSALRHRGAYVITGGFGQVGLAIAGRLAATKAARLLLVGRSVPPDRALWDACLASQSTDAEVVKQIAAIRRLERLGGEVLVGAADVADEQRMKEVIAQARSHFGEIHGVFHAAGTTRGAGIGPLATLDRHACDAQFRPKVQGVQALERAIAGMQVEFLVLTSSLSSILGGLGFGAYAAANRFEDAFVEAHAGSGPRWISIDFDGWRFGETATTSAVAELAMTPDEGLDAIARVLDTPGMRRVAISTASLDARVDRYVRQAASPAPATAGALQQYARPDIDAYVEPEDEIESAMADIWQDLVGIDRVGRLDNFFDLGGHSLLATRVIAHIKQRWAVDVPLKAFFESPTVAELAERVSTLRWAAQGPSGESVASATEREEIEL
jgi:acyl transferase domain-containing protein